MCCGQVARQVTDADAKAIYTRYHAGELKWHLCAEYRIGTPEFDRVLALGRILQWHATAGNTLTGSITHVEAL